MLIRGETLVSLWIPKSAVLIKEPRLFEAWSLLEEIRQLSKTSSHRLSFNITVSIWEGIIGGVKQGSIPG